MTDDNDRSARHLRRLIAAEKAETRMPPSARARVWDGIEASIMAPPVVAPHRLGRVLRQAAIGRGAATALLSAAIGGAGGMALQAHRDRIALGAAPVASSQAVAPVGPVVEPAPTPVALAPPSIGTPVPAAPKPLPRPRHPVLSKTASKPQPPSPPQPTTEVESSLAEERNLLDTARTALARGDAPGALELLAKHARTYADGAFAEERSALQIQAWLSAGDADKARAAAAAFRAKYPKSLLLPAIDRSLEEP